MKIRQWIFLKFVCILVFPFLSIAQTRAIKGTVTDSTTGKSVQDVTVSLLKDAKAVATTFSDEKGNFTFTDIPSGGYQLYITLMGYQPYNTKLDVSKQLINLGKIRLQNKTITLNAIEVKQLIPPVAIKKDTIEFNATIIKTRPNAVVEELLSRIPGISIDPNGKITAHGETVKRILVDGKPFFGDNTALTTRNLPAEMIDKIQVINGKSEQAQFSGFDDGYNEKIINITLKKNRRRGTTATTSAGYGTNDRFAASGNVNSFNEQDRISVIGNGNNLNDRNFNPANIFAGALPSTGVSRVWSGAVNYNYENKKKLRLDASYDAANTHFENNTNSFRQTFLPDSTWYYNQQNNTTTITTEHNIRMRLAYRIDSSQSFLLMPNISYNNSNNIQNNKYETLNNNRDTSIAGISRNTSHQTSPTVNLHTLYRKKFKKKGQTFSADIALNSNNSNGNNTYQTKDNYLLLDSISSYDRLTTNKNKNTSLNMRLSYTTPIGTDRFMEVSYSLNNQLAKLINKTYDIDTTSGKYANANDSLSNTSNNKFLSQTTGISIRTNKLGYEYVLGLNAQYSTIKNENTNQLSFHQQYFNLFPTAALRVNLNKEKMLNAFYIGNTIRPTAQQLQPLPNLSNSLLIQEGNPDLKQSFQHNLTLSYRAYNPTSFQSFIAQINTELTQNKIVTTNYYDTAGHQYTKPVNANGAFYISGNVTNSFPIKSLHTTINITSAFNYNKDITFTNNLKAFTHNYTLTEEANINYNYKSIFNINTSFQFSYNGARYGALSNNNTNYLTYQLFCNYFLNLPAGFIIGNDLRYIINSGRAAGYNTNVALLNGYIAKSLFKQKQALIKLYAYDLLHQNVSISRNVNDNYIEDMRQTVLKPYIMLSFTWFFKNYPAGGIIPNEKGS